VEVTELLSKIQNGDHEAGEHLLPVVYEELRRLANAKLRNERSDHTLQPTALVHEAYLRLVGPQSNDRVWDGEPHFFAAAAEAMRRILVDHARARLRIKRGKGWVRHDIEGIDFSSPDSIEPENLIELDQALTKLQSHDPTAADLIQFRFFAGQTMSQAADNLGISIRTANRTWAFARAWLFDQLEQQMS
jgi:RNA polymerase sigma factor (TIGR02999 family)